MDHGPASDVRDRRRVRRRGRRRPARAHGRDRLPALESEDSVHGPCLLWDGDTAGRHLSRRASRRCVCTVPYGIAAGGARSSGCR
ncbi:hypothetical protein ACRAWF_02955 [Streptomyces sp. L7]